MNFLPYEISAMSFLEALSTSGLGFVIVLIVLAVLAVFVMLMSRAINGKKAKASADNSTADSVADASAPAATTADALQNPAQPAAEKEDEAISPAEAIPHIPGYVVLDGVSEQDAAVLMAITSHKTGIDLSRLDFKSIKRLGQDPVLENISEQDAAAVMAVTSHKTGIPLENLIFNSIKLVEE